MNNHQQIFVPHAERPLAHFDEVQEVEHDTIWENPTDRDIVLNLYVGTTPGVRKDKDGVPRKLNQEERYGIRQYVIRKGTTRSLPKEFDKAVQDVHNGVIMGGLGPHLINRGAQVRPKLHPSLDDKLAEQKMLVEKQVEAAKALQAQQEAMIVLQARVEAAKAATANSGDLSGIVPSKEHAETSEAPLARRTSKTEK